MAACQSTVETAPRTRVTIASRSSRSSTRDRVGADAPVDRASSRTPYGGAASMDGPHGSSGTPTPQGPQLVVSWPRVALGPVGRNEQPRRRDLDPGVARDVDVADPAGAKQGPGARGEIGGRYNGHGARRSAGRDRREPLDCLKNVARLESSLDLDGRGPRSRPLVTRSPPADRRGNDRAIRSAERRATSRLEFAQPETARTGARPAIRSGAACRSLHEILFPARRSQYCSVSA